MHGRRCADPVILDLWHPIASLAELPTGMRSRTVLLEERVGYGKAQDGVASVWLESGSEDGGGRPLPAKAAYGYLWTTLGRDPAALFAIPEYDEIDRRKFNAATIGVNVSAPRAVENFLDLGHLPFVHSGILGAELHTEVKEYDVEVATERDEIRATRCLVFQPKASAHATDGGDVEYSYRVPHPYCAVLYKSSAADPSQLDRAAGPAGQSGEHPRPPPDVQDRRDEPGKRDKAVSADDLRSGQADPGKPVSKEAAARPARRNVDPLRQIGIAYRRWLSRKGITYGVIPAAA